MGRPSNIVVRNKDFQKLAQKYLQYITRLGFNENGNKARFNYLREFLSWLECQGHSQIETITTTDILSYYEHICNRPSKRDGGTLTLKTSHSHTIIIRDLFTMLQQEGKVQTNPCSTLKFPYPKTSEERTILTLEEVRELYAVSESAQERAILSLAYGCGLRASELAGCNIDDIKLRDKILIVPKGKGNKRRVVPMSSGVIKNLSEYYYNERDQLIEGRDFNPKDNAFMLHIRGGRMKNYTYNKYFNRMIKRTSIPTEKQDRLSLHNLRHSIASHLLEQGIPVEQVRMFLGHNQLETTQIYTHIHIRQLRQLNESL